MNFADTAIARAVASVLPYVIDNDSLITAFRSYAGWSYSQGRIVPLLKPRSVGWSTITFDTLAKRQGMQHFK